MIQPSNVLSYHHQVKLQDNIK